MKTQINHLVSGTTGIVGTSMAIRQEVGKKVLEENGDILRIMIKGVELEMHRSCSGSGKSWWWTAELTEEQYAIITDGNTLGVSTRINSYSLSISQDLRITAYVSHRANERQQWRQGWSQLIQESNITIL
jgi:hypothetical protein